MGSTKLVRWAAVGTCLGLGWLTLAYGFPLRTCLWDPACAEELAGALGMDWKTWVTSPKVDRAIDLTGIVIGSVLLLGALTLATVSSPSFLVSSLITLILLLRHFLFWKEHFYQIGFLLELSLQTGAVYLSYRVLTRRSWVGLARLFTALTFIGHGLYAYGFYPVPGHFVGMLTAGLGMSNDGALELLKVVGLLDFLAAILLLLPPRRAVFYALCWIIPWAVLTSFARVYSYLGIVSLENLLLQWLPEVILRMAHILIPLAIYRVFFGTISGWPSGRVRGSRGLN